MTLDLFLVDNACQSVGPVLWSLEAGPERAVATGPELFDNKLNSIKFMPERNHNLREGEARWYQCFGMEAR